MKPYAKGAFPSYVDKKGRGLAKCQRYYYIAYCPRNVIEGGGIKNPVNIIYEWPLIVDSVTYLLDGIQNDRRPMNI